ncbi:hypothetical protein V1460_20035 [Streptomyces sp. SCSIO 30461]|uniref:hypothetical protein n=1 Tax=Streptomyces sp. SCSIO 30461 TaxID=3118085 RepID=UPI0030D2B5BA
MPTVRRGGARACTIAVLAVLLLAVTGLLPATAHAASGVEAVADALRKSPVYVDPRAAEQLPGTYAEALAERIRNANKPVFVAVLPSTPEYPRVSVLSSVRALTRITGVYAIHLGDGFNAGADPSVMSQNAVDNLKNAVRPSVHDPETELDAFVDQALKQAKGNAPASWANGSGEDRSGAASAWIAGGVLVVCGGGAYALHRRADKKRATRERDELDALRILVDEDITAFGEELDGAAFSPSHPEATDSMRDDYTYALDMYDTAKEQIASAARPADIQPVTKTLAEGRFALATLEARRTGAPLPQRRLPCFFDPRHGPSVTDTFWSPPYGTARPVPTCAADAARIHSGQDPAARMVVTQQGPKPYWDAGPAYAPWAGGYFGGAGGVLTGLLVGTALGSVLGAPAAFAVADLLDDQHFPDGGEFSGADFDPADYGGGPAGTGFGADTGDGFGGGDW